MFLPLFSAVEFGYVQPNQSSQPMKITADEYDIQLLHLSTDEYI